MYEKEVRAGAALLDEARPGWDKWINLETLDVASGLHCVLGQLFGGFSEGCVWLELVGWDASNNGFSLADGTGFHAEYIPLTNAWLSLIAERRAPKIKLVPIVAVERELVAA